MKKITLVLFPALFLYTISASAMNEQKKYKKEKHRVPLYQKILFERCDNCGRYRVSHKDFTFCSKKKTSSE